MSTFIDDLKKDHQKLLGTLQEAQALGWGTCAGRIKLLECKELLVAHLNKENTRLYPEMRKCSHDNASTEKTVGDFTSEMESLTKDVVAFIANADKMTLGMDYARELGKIISIVKRRISREETLLYPLYEKLAKAC